MTNLSKKTKVSVCSPQQREPFESSIYFLKWHKKIPVAKLLNFFNHIPLGKI